MSSSNQRRKRDLPAIDIFDSSNVVIKGTLIGGYGTGIRIASDVDGAEVDNVEIVDADTAIKNSGQLKARRIKARRRSKK